MMQDVRTSEQKTQVALRPSIVEFFGIDGLFGYRSISLSSRYAATVLIAKNGSGKTTLIGALDAFLRGQFARLVGLDFTQITCRLRGVVDPLVLHKRDIDELVTASESLEFVTRAKALEITPQALLELVEGYSESSSNPELLADPAFHSIYVRVGYDIGLAKAECVKISSSLNTGNENVRNIKESLKAVMAGIEIVYLPTYRRIELSIPDSEARPGRPRKSFRERLGVSRSGLHTGDIQFGLGDISDRLATLYRQMMSQSNQGYGKVSAKIINDLITGEFERSSPSLEERPSKEALKIFFSRLQNSERDYRFGPYNYLEIPDLDKVYSANVPAGSDKFLTYFLGQLNSVMQKTRDVEGTVEQFIDNCNRYLSGEDSSVTLRDGTQVNTSDDKELTFDRQSLKVTVSSRRTKRNIPLDALSSGEKQMISLFARLYLYPKNKLILIDEPELSLSLDWQRKILPDILAATKCEQVIAITHSPFIFDNELEPFAASLHTEFVSPIEQGLFSDSIPLDADGTGELGDE